MTDLFGGSSSSDADTDDLIAQAQAQPIAKKKDGAAAAAKKKQPPKKKIPDADHDDDDSDSSSDDGGLFDSSSEDEDDGGGAKKLLGKKRKKKKSSASKKKPSAKKKDTRSMKERMEALASKKRAKDGTGGEEGERKSRRKRSKKEKKEGGDTKGGEKGEGYESGDSYDSATFERTKDDDDFIDADDEDPDALKELYSEQKFDDERPDSSDEEKKAKKKKGSGGSGKGGGLDKISLSDDEGAPSATSALKEAVRRMQKKKKKAKPLSELEEEGTAFLKKMDEAADADDESIANKTPAVKKLAMLPEVMDTLAKKDLVRVLLDLDLLSVCKRWVQPLPNGTLGNVTLRRRVIESISNMTGDNGINASDLKQSGFGRVVMALYMHKSETPEMKRLLKSLIEQWSRPIFQKSGNLGDLERVQAARAAGGPTDTVAGIASAHAAEARQEQQLLRRQSSGGGGGAADAVDRIISEGSKTANDLGNNRVRVPFSKGFQYSVRPGDRRGDVSDKRNLISAKAYREQATGGRGGGEGGKKDNLDKKMADRMKKKNKAAQRSANISINR